MPAELAIRRALRGLLVVLAWFSPLPAQEPAPRPPAVEPAPPPVPVPVERAQPNPSSQDPARPAAQDPMRTARPADPDPHAQEPQDPAAGERRDGGRRRGQRGDGEAQGDGESEEDGEPKEPRRGIPVEDLLVETHCARCHERSAEGLLTRISFVRKSPEGWAETIKRMIRLHGVQMSPGDAREIVRYLGNRHGLTRGEAERGFYEAERRVHWSEEHHEQDLRETCAGCHTLGRVLSQQRDGQEWRELRNTHVAMFPLARGQMGGGPPPDETERAMRERFSGGGASTQRGSTARSGRGTSGGTGTGGGGAGDGGGPPRRGGSDERGDRVLQQLAAAQPLFTAEWERWQLNRRAVPLAGTWTLTGHEVGRGDLVGTVEIERTGDDEYEVRWDYELRDQRVQRRGKGLLYGGCSWRGRSTETGETARTWREVLLLDERWETLHGRCFTGEYDEIGIDVQLHRHRGVPTAMHVVRPWVTVPARGREIEVHGEAFPDDVTAADFQLGRGVTVTACRRIDDRRVVLTVDTAPDATCGPRDLAYGSQPARTQIVLFDAVDYVRIRPLQGLARIGGVSYPKQLERYEAVAVHRGPDGKPYTDDDVDLWMVDAEWSLAESPVRDDDDDLQYVGTIDAYTGVFTPAVEGPNPSRKWSANNVGEVYVECRVTLDVPVRNEPKPKPVEPARDGSGAEPGREGEAQREGEPRREGEEPRVEAPPPPPPEPAAAETGEPATAGDPVIERRSFRARAHLLVTVPLYMRWNALEWEAR